MKKITDKSSRTCNNVALFDYSAETSSSLVKSVGNFESAIMATDKKKLSRCSYNMQLLNTLPYVSATDNVPKGYEIKVDSTPIK